MNEGAAGELFHCPVAECAKSLNSSFSLRRHMHLMHTERKALACRYCGKAFSLKQYLMEHEYMHTEELPFLCGFNGCPERFRQRGKLCLHRRKHEGYVTRQYKYPDMEERHHRRMQRRKKRSRKSRAKQVQPVEPQETQNEKSADQDTGNELIT